MPSGPPLVIEGEIAIQSMNDELSESEVSVEFPTSLPFFDILIWQAGIWGYRAVAFYFTDGKHAIRWDWERKIVYQGMQVKVSRNGRAPRILLLMGALIVGVAAIWLRRKNQA